MKYKIKNMGCSTRQVFLDGKNQVLAPGEEIISGEPINDGQLRCLRYEESLVEKSEKVKGGKKDGSTNDVEQERASSNIKA